jgi:hypothetical protein
MTVNLYAPPPDIVAASSPRIDQTPVDNNAKASNIQDPAYELPRRPLLDNWVNKRCGVWRAVLHRVKCNKAKGVRL